MNSEPQSAAEPSTAEQLASLIVPPVLARGRPPANPRLLLTAVAVAALMHIYAAVLLPNVLDVEFDEEPEANLINEEIGHDPDMATVYDTGDITDITIPGPINPNELVGTPIWVPDAPITVAPQPRDGANRQQGNGRARRLIIYTK